MRRFCSTILLLAGLAWHGSALPADARMGGTVKEFERYLNSLPGSNFKRVPDEAHPGILYAGRLAEFTGHPGEIRSLMDQARAMRGSIIGTGRRSMTTSYRGASITLGLDSSPNEIHPHPTRGAWGLLFWSADAERIIRKPAL
jgi:hypothetical protein